MTTTEAEMLKMIRAQPDAECWLLPASWYKKFAIEPMKAENPRDYMKRDYMGGLALTQYGPAIFHNEPQKDANGSVKLIPMFPLEQIPIKTECRPFTGDASKLNVHPRLAEIAEEETLTNTLSSHIPPHDSSPELHCADSNPPPSPDDICSLPVHSD